MPIDRTTLRLIYLRRVVVTLANILGPRTSTAYARWLARGVFDLNPQAKIDAMNNIRAAYGDRVCPAQIEALTRSTFENIATFWVEIFSLSRKLRPSSWRHYVEVEDESFFRSVAESQRGALFVTAYLGNFAIAAYAVAQMLRPLYVVIDEAQHPVLRSWQDELYHQPNIKLLSRRQAQVGLADLLRNGQKALLVGEHVRSRGRAIEIPYLGGVCRCYPTVGLLARWCDVPVLMVSARRTNDVFRLVVSGKRIVDPREVEHEDDPTAEITRRYMSALESIIRQWPEQYLWTRILVPDDKGAKRRPPGESSGPSPSVQPRVDSPNA